jgi:hypothetical protein
MPTPHLTAVARSNGHRLLLFLLLSLHARRAARLLPRLLYLPRRPALSTTLLHLRVAVRPETDDEQCARPA